jgi:Right handed beta helix region
MATYLLYNGASISSANVPASRAVPVVSSDPADLLVASIAGREVGRAVGNGARVDTVVCDLRGLSGRTGIRVARTVGKIVSNIDKSFIAVPDPQPGPGNPGVPVGTLLTPRAGFTASAAGAVYEGLDIVGQVRVNAAGVTFRGCRFTGAGTLVVGSGAGTVFEDCELDGGGTAGQGLMLNRITVRRCNVHGMSDGIRVTTATLIEDTWVHHLARQAPAHPDCIQTTGGTGSVIRHNTLEAENPDTGDLCNAAIMVGGATSPLVDLLIEDNWLSGGNDTVSVRTGGVESVTIRGNRYGRNYRYRPFIGPAHVTPVGDVYDDTGEPIPINRW